MSIPALCKLELKPALRNGERLRDGAWKTARNFLDFAVDGLSLHQTLSLTKGHDLISVLCLDWPGPSIQATERLLLVRDADLPNDRRSLFTCPECGDLGCGAITARVSRDNDRFTWCDFGYENNWEEGVLTDDYQEYGPFSFDRAEYEQTLTGAVALLRSLHNAAK